MSMIQHSYTLIKINQSIKNKICIWWRSKCALLASSRAQNPIHSFFWVTSEKLFTLHYHRMQLL